MTQQERSRKWYEANRSVAIERAKQRRLDNVTKTAAYMKKYREENHERVSNHKRKWEKEHAQEIAKRRRQNLDHRLAHALRNRTRLALKNLQKSGSAVRDLGCTIQELKAHLEERFLSGMTWDNWGRYGWHIDHVVPLVAFDLSDREQFLKACHYTNLQPLWATDNLKKYNYV